MHRMATQKRRIVYLSDEEWLMLKAHARAHGVSISQTIRDMWNIAAQANPASRSTTIAINRAAKIERDTFGHARPAPKPHR
jgi:hypothetical protein